MRRGVLIISASMGAGHDGAARELQRRLEQRGHDVTIVDYLTMIPLRLGGFVRWTYLAQLKYAAWSYDLTYKALGSYAAVLWGPVVRIMSFATRHALERTLRKTRPDAIVSTYPLASLVLGRMRKKGWLRVPVATYLTDFAVHPLWVHPGVDVHLAVSPVSAETAAKRGAHDNRASGPLVGEHFRSPATTRAEMRDRLGIAHHERAVLVVAGSWGVGDVASTVRAIARCGDYHPITVCGRDEKLRTSLVAEGLGGTVLGWTDEMPALMAAADALVENAGGLTAMEAFAAGLPVVTFQAIAGHGKDNATYMDRSGVSRYARTERDLREALAVATTPGPERERMIAAGRALFAGDPADDVMELASCTRADQLLVPFQHPRGPRRVAILAASIAALYGALTIGAAGVSALGVGVAKAPSNRPRATYLGVRVDAAELFHTSLMTAIRELHATLVVDALTADQSGRQLAYLAATGIDIGNGGWGQSRTLRWNRAHDDCKKAAQVIAARAHTMPEELVPSRRIDAFDQIYCHTGRVRQRLVEPNTTFVPGVVPEVKGRHVYLLDARDRDGQSVVKTLESFHRRARRADLSVHPLEDLH